MPLSEYHDIKLAEGEGCLNIVQKAPSPLYSGSNSTSSAGQHLATSRNKAISQSPKFRVEIVTADEEPRINKILPTKSLKRVCHCLHLNKL